MQPERLFYKGLPNKGKSGQSLVNLRGQYRVKKRGTLKEDSSLELKRINMSYIDLKRLISGKSCTIPCTLFHNKYQVLTSALADFKANTFTLIDT
jgi:predicted NUDIX family phosphoesterase